MDKTTKVIIIIILIALALFFLNKSHIINLNDLFSVTQNQIASSASGGGGP